MSGANNSKTLPRPEAGDRDRAPVVSVPKNITSGAPQLGEPRAVHEPFSWLNSSFSSDHQSQFVALTMDVCNGVQTCLQLLHSDMLTRNSNQWADLSDANAPILDKAGGERLLLLATAAARMLSERAEEQIENLNDRAARAGADAKAS